MDRFPDDRVAAIKGEKTQVALAQDFAPHLSQIKQGRDQLAKGAVSAAAMLALMPEIGTLDRNQRASRACLAPIPRQSGTRQGKPASTANDGASHLP